MNHPVSNKRFLSIVISIGMLVVLSITCTIPGTSGGGSDATVAAMSAQGTALAMQATMDSMSLQATNMALQSSSQTITTEEPLITVPPDLATEAPPTPYIAPGQSMDLDALRKGAKILLFEDMSGNELKLERWVMPALDGADYVYTDVGSAQGWFKKELTGTAEWDLIIASSEYGGRINGEYFDFIWEHMQKGTAVIFELWDMDSILQGKVEKILNECGVEHEYDWINPGMRDIWYLIPDHPILNEPNRMGQLRTNKFWKGDVGDLMTIKYYNNQAVGDAALVIGSDSDFQDSRAVLTTCMGGRMVLQTFGSHDYNREDMIKLWQNYIYYTLTNHFTYILQ